MESISCSFSLRVDTSNTLMVIRLKQEIRNPKPIPRAHALIINRTRESLRSPHTRKLEKGYTQRAPRTAFKGLVSVYAINVETMLTRAEKARMCFSSTVAIILSSGNFIFVAICSLIKCVQHV